MANAPKKNHVHQALRKAFAAQLRRARRRAGISQEVLAYEAGVERGYMSGLERGKHTPSIWTIWRMLPSLDLSFSEFCAAIEEAMPRRRKRS